MVGLAGGGGGAPPRPEPGRGTKRARTDDPMPEATVRPKHGRRLRILLLYAGRASSPSDASGSIAGDKARGHAIVINEVDLLKIRFRTKRRGPKMTSLTSAALTGEHDVVIAIPPASTFSRAPLRVAAGPPPVRQKRQVYGLKTLHGGHRESVRSETSSLQVVGKLLESQAASQNWFILVGNEDLGRTEEGHWPATIWELSEIQCLTRSCASITGAVALGSYGASALAPCRMASNLPGLDRSLHIGPPEFDKSGH